MGTWGIGISSNDAYADFYGEIMDKYNQGIPIQEAIDEVIKDNEKINLNSEDTLHNLYFAAIYAGWECGVVDKRVFEKVKNIIDSGKDIDCWRVLGASEKDLKKRAGVLKAFLNKISIPRERIKKPKPIKFKPAIYEKGDVLSVLLDDGSYTGAVVLEKEDGQEFGSNFIVKAFMKRSSMATVEEILNAKIYDYCWYLGVHYRKYLPQISVIGKIDIRHKYIAGGIGSIHSGWISFVSENHEKYYRIEENSDIKNIAAFLELTPDEVAKRQKQRVKNSLIKSGLN